MGRSDGFIGSTINRGSIPGIDLLAEIADACGFQIYAVGHDVRFNLNESASNSIDNFRDDVVGQFFNVSFDSDVVDPGAVEVVKTVRINSGEPVADDAQGGEE